MTTVEKIAVMQAYVEGKLIHVRRCGADAWGVAINPHWGWGDYDYRIAPVEPVVVNRYAVLNKFGREIVAFFREEDARIVVAQIPGATVVALTGTFVPSV